MDIRFFALSARYIEDELELFVYRYFESVSSPDRYFENCIESKLEETAGKETGREGKSREGEEEKKEKKADDALMLIYQNLEDRMKSVMGTKVSIHNKDKNKGRIEIEYYSEAELERIVEMIESIG